MRDLEPLVHAITAHVQAHLTPPRLARVPVADVHARAVAELSTRFTADRDSLPVGYLAQPRFRAAYLVYFLPTGVATIGDILQRSGVLQPPRPLRVLDVGAGPLTASIAVAMATDQPLEIVAIDRTRASLDDGAALLRRLRPDVAVRTVVGNLRHGRELAQVGGPFDLILLGNVLNESGVGGPKALSAETFVESLLADRLAEGGAVVMVEPGTRDGSRRLIEVREHLREVAPDLAILSPCVGDIPCPLARDSRLWCHAEQPWRRPALLEAIDAKIGHARTSLKSSHLVLVDRPRPSPVPHAWRVIGGLMRTGDLERRYLCGAEGRVVAVAPRLPAELGQAWRGDLVTVPGSLRRQQGPRRETILEPVRVAPPRRPR